MKYLFFLAMTAFLAACNSSANSGKSTMDSASNDSVSRKDTIVQNIDTANATALFLGSDGNVKHSKALVVRKGFIGKKDGKWGWTKIDKVEVYDTARRPISNVIQVL